VKNLGQTSPLWYYPNVGLTTKRRYHSGLLADLSMLGGGVCYEIGASVRSCLLRRFWYRRLEQPNYSLPPSQGWDLG
jgi:hypothetical protein